METLVQTLWYRLYGTDSMVWTLWYGLYGTDSMVRTLWYGLYGTDSMVQNQTSFQTAITNVNVAFPCMHEATVLVPHDTVSKGYYSTMCP